MESKHTPGPWVWSGNALLSDQTADGYSEPVMRAEDGAFAPNDADKALIAAAPDLLKACVMVRARMQAYRLDLDASNALDAVNAAISKAENQKD